MTTSLTTRPNLAIGRVRSPAVERTPLSLPANLTTLAGALLAHHSDLMLRGLTLAVASTVDVCAVHTSLPLLLGDLARCAPALVIMEDRLSDRPDCTAIAQIAQVRAAAPHARLILVGNLYDGVYVGDLLNAGAHAYLCAADALTALLPDAIHAVLNGRSYLSPVAAANHLALRELNRHGRRTVLEPDERRALALLLDGCGVPETVRCLGVPRARVYRLHRRLRARFGVTTNEALIQRVLLSGLLAES